MVIINLTPYLLYLSIKYCSIVILTFVDFSLLTNQKCKLGMSIWWLFFNVNSHCFWEHTYKTAVIHFKIIFSWLYNESPNPFIMLITLLCVQMFFESLAWLQNYLNFAHTAWRHIYEVSVYCFFPLTPTFLLLYIVCTLFTSVIIPFRFH